MITQWLLRLLHAEKKITSLPIVTAFTSLEEKKQESLLAKPTGVNVLLKPWWQWRYQASLRHAESAITPLSSIEIYQSSLLERTSIH
jgi:hypothetical protein